MTVSPVRPKRTNTVDAVKDAKLLPNTLAELNRELDGLRNLGLEALRAYWFERFGNAAPKTLPCHKLARAIGYRLQAAYFGVEDTLIQGQGASRFSCLTDGVGAPILLRRTWGGKDHEVTRDGEKYLYEGTRYGSISAVARAITGTRWNGWTFFGLQSPFKAESVARG